MNRRAVFRWFGSLVTGFATLAVPGCASTPRYACPVPEGNGGCHSVAEVYRETLPSDVAPMPGRHSAGGAADPEREVREGDGLARLYAAATPVALVRPPSAGAALLTTPHVLRVFVTSWQDDEGDLEAGGFIYLRLDQGQWTISR